MEPSAITRLSHASIRLCLREALSEGDFVWLCLGLGLSEYVNLLSPSNQSAFLSSPLDSSSRPQSVVLREPNLPDLEPYLQVEHAELIKVFEKKLADDPEFPCCSCERLLQRKQVTALKYSDRKFSSDIWKTLKHHVSKRETHYVCAYCRVRLNRNEMPSRCVLNGSRPTGA